MSESIKKDTWSYLKHHTDARIALGRTGKSLPTNELLNFSLSHALAKDAIYKELAIEEIKDFIKKQNINSVIVESKAQDKKTYLINPPLGKQLNDSSKSKLQNQILEKENISIIIADGLSATAANTNAIPLLKEILTHIKETKFILSPIIIAKHARVALCDEIGEILSSKASLILIGERPGLTAPDSLGVYLTWKPKVGRNDSERNCISNIRSQGLSYEQAAFKIIWLLNEAEKLGCTGIQLKDDSPNIKRLT